MAAKEIIVSYDAGGDMEDIEFDMALMNFFRSVGFRFRQATMAQERKLYFTRVGSEKDK